MAKQKTKKLLDKIRGPKDLKKFSVPELQNLAKEIRSVLIRTVARNGGHLASNLGVVDLTLALHYVFSSPNDKLIWDVSHQAYTHKLLTGRNKNFQSLRQLKGLSGYSKRSESPHDAFGAGHVGTAVSAALGFAEARDIKKQNKQVVAVIGDGSLTNGLTFEGLNNAGNNETDITVVLNDNKFSISKNVGGIAKYLEKLSTIQINENEETDFESIFHSLGFKYFGPIDGHNLEALIDVLKLAKETKGPKLIHIVTKKGNGYLHSELNPESFHSTSPFVLESGKVAKDTKNLTYTKVFSKTLNKLAKKNKKIIAITAAMPAGTGLDKFAKKFPDRFFDVGIAEEHAVTFAAGLACEGLRPVVALYSSFLQRAYDQILHDVALQNLPVIFAIDRGGIVGADGPTHHGVFDLSFLRNIPGIVIMSPKDENELQHMIHSATRYKKGPIVIRYPRGVGNGTKLDKRLRRIPIGKAEKIIDYGREASIIAVGSMVYPAVKAAEILKNKSIAINVYNARTVKPIDKRMIKEAATTGKIITVEENILDGGFGSAVLEEIEKLNIKNCNISRIGIEKFVEHGNVDKLRQQCGLTTENIVKKVINLIQKS